MDALLGDEAAAARDGVHYLLLDLCVTLLSWSPLFPPLRSDALGRRLPEQWSSAAQQIINFLVGASDVHTMCRDVQDSRDSSSKTL